MNPVKEMAIDTVDLLYSMGCVAVRMDRIGSHYRVTAIGDPMLSCVTDETIKAKLRRFASERGMNPSLILDYQFPPSCHPADGVYSSPRYLIDWRLA